jgi:GNAT superfamily N-acetyltransferase
MIHTASPAALPRLKALLARANDAPYDLARVAEEKLFGLGVAGAPAVRVWGDEEGLAVTCGRFLRLLAVDRSHRRRGIGTALLDDAIALGARVAFAEPGNYFLPGVLEPQFFANRGWRQTAATQNMETSALPAHAPAGVARATHAMRERVLGFIEREFGRIWRFEVTAAFERESPPLFVTEEEGILTGFAAHEVNNRGLGFFGPTGVAAWQRGRGLGTRLLHASLFDLRQLGFTRAVIPWTDAVDFYAKACGAVVTQHFVTMTLASPPPPPAAR